MTEIKLNSLELYRDNKYYEPINYYMRTGLFKKTDTITSEDELKTVIADIKRNMEPLGKDTILYRGMSYPIEKLEETGAEVYDLAFMSTSLDENQVYSYTMGSICCIFEIQVDGDINGIRVEGSEKEEVLLQNGLKLVDFIYLGLKETPVGAKMFFRCRGRKTTIEERSSILKEAQARELLNMEYQHIYENRVRQMLLAEDFHLPK